MPNPLFWTGLITAAGAGLSGYMQSKAGERVTKERKRLADEEAERIQKEVLPRIEQFVKDNGYSQEAMEEAIGRIATVMDNAREETRAAIQLGIESSIKQMQDAYGWSTEDLNAQLGEFNEIMDKESESFRKTWGEGFKKMQDSLSRGRLLRSGFGTTLSKQSLEKLGMGEQEIAEKRSKVQKEYGRQLAQLGSKLQSNMKAVQAEGASRIAQMMAQMNVQESQMSEQQRKRMEDINRQLAQYGLSQGLAAENQARLLQQQAGIAEAQQPTGTEAFLGGLFGPAGISGIASMFAGGTAPSTTPPALFDTNKK